MSDNQTKPNKRRGKRNIRTYTNIYSFPSVSNVDNTKVVERKKMYSF